MLLSIISAAGIVYTGDVEMIVVPGAKGDFGVLDRHAPFMTSLRKGPVTLYKNKYPQQTFTISGGFCEVTPDRCLILADGIL